MSPIGRIFSVLNLILAGLFLGWAANALATNAGYKDKFDTTSTELKTTKTQLESDLSKVRMEKTEAENKAGRLLQERDEEKNRADRSKGDLDLEVAKNAQMRADLDKIAATLSEIESSKTKLQADKDRAAQAQRDAEKARDGAVAAKMEAEKKAGDSDGELGKAKNTIADLEKARTSLEKDKKGVETELASLVAATGVKLGDISSMPLIEGRVLDVSTTVEPGLVAINVGEANGVKRGYTFEIFDGKTYKGQARVEYVHPNMCSAILVRTVPGQKIRQGDGAATRL